MKAIFLLLSLVLLVSGTASAYSISAAASLDHRTNRHGVGAFASKSKPFSPLFSSASPDDSKPPSSSAAAAKTEAWTEKRFFNTPVFRAAALVGAAVLAQSQSQLLSSKALALVHMLSFSTWFGSVVYTTFIAGITMFKNLPKKTFGKLQAKLFPKYFLLGSVCLILQLGTLPGIKSLTKQSRTALGVALAMNLFNQFILEPTATNNMLERYRMEEQGKESSDEYKALRKNFGKFHGLSSLTNLVALCGGVAHAVYLAAALV
ncbi:hypothetical protein MPSEU_000986200 [Mayamaea pseudoterrestris]|nr:hypothetical protein MPSEU_000986200 [Mayamaea pseudoterrestris]